MLEVKFVKREFSFFFFWSVSVPKCKLQLDVRINSSTFWTKGSSIHATDEKNYQFFLPKFFIIWTKWARCWKIKKKIEKEKSHDTNFAMVHHGVLGWFGFFLSSGGLVRRPDRGWVCGRSLKHSHELWITVLMQTNSIERFSSELI